jgi:hypothetical protein
LGTFIGLGVPSKSSGGKPGSSGVPPAVPVAEGAAGSVAAASTVVSDYLPQLARARAETARRAGTMDVVFMC